MGPLTDLMILEERVDAAGTAWSRIVASDGTTGWIRTIDTAPLPQASVTLPETGAGRPIRVGAGAVLPWVVLASVLLVGAIGTKRRTA